MKNPTPAALLALLMALTAACDKSTSTVSKQLDELQRKTAQAEQRQKELEQQMAEQKLAAETDAIERERMQLDADRQELARTKKQLDSEQATALRVREEALTRREYRIEQSRDSLFDQEQDRSTRGANLNEREARIAGREALTFRPRNQNIPVGDYSNFYDSLSSYGSWFQTPNYGYVWQPVAVRESNWRPYSRGRWICSDRGWTWASDEPFGWATYHYGRWARLRNRGWVWVPGSEWAPSWVSWRESGRHVGWAPLPPETLAYRGQRWDESVETQFRIAPTWYNFVEVNHFGNSVYQHCLPVSQNITYINQTRNITYIHIQNSQVICGGPRYDEINRRSERQIPFYRLEMDEHSRPSRDMIGMRPRFEGDRMMVSAPNMDAGWNEGLRPRDIRGQIESEVERDAPLDREITDRFREDRQTRSQSATRAIKKLGGEEDFSERRLEELEENRKEAEVIFEKEVPEPPPGQQPPAGQATLPDRPRNTAEELPREEMAEERPRPPIPEEPSRQSSAARGEEVAPKPAPAAPEMAEPTPPPAPDAGPLEPAPEERAPVPPAIPQPAAPEEATVEPTANQQREQAEQAEELREAAAANQKASADALQQEQQEKQAQQREAEATREVQENQQRQLEQARAEQQEQQRAAEEERQQQEERQKPPPSE